jgi:glycosyltransferase involved in cell wall biosynthesis
MKLAMVFPNPSSEKGISKYSLDLLENLEKQGVKIDEFNFIQGKPYTLFKKFSLLLKCDVIHIQHEYNLLGWFGLPYFFLLGLLKFFRKNILVITMHTVLSPKEKFKSGKIKTFLRKILYKTQNKWIGWASNKIIVHSKAFRKILVEEYSISKNKVEVFPHAIIENIKTFSKKEAKKELHLKGNVYLLIGTMIPDHGHDIILKQANKIGKTILVVSNPNSVNDRNISKIKDFVEKNKKIVKENHFEKFVRFDLGEISYKRWWMYFSAADLVLLPYKGGIGSGIFADAMAMEKPVIASNVRYFKEFAEDYGCIKLAKEDSNFPDKIKEAMKPKNYKIMTKECERYFKENGLTPISKRYKQFYNSLI